MARNLIARRRRQRSASSIRGWRGAGVAALVLASLASFACGAPEPSTLAQIVERHTEAMGGREKLATLRSVLRQRNETTFTLRAKPHFHLVLLLEEDGSLRYAEGFDGEVAWEQSGDGPRTVVEGRPREALWHTTQFPSNLNPLHGVEGRGHALALVGRDTLDGTAYHHLRLTLSDGFVRDYYLSAETYRIERSRDVRRHHAYEEDVQPIEAVWSDFRRVDGFWFPFVEIERNYETGERLWGGTPHRRVHVNVEVPESVFRPDGDLAPLRVWLEDRS